MIVFVFTLLIFHLVLFPILLLRLNLGLGLRLRLINVILQLILLFPSTLQLVRLVDVHHLLVPIAILLPACAAAGARKTGRRGGDRRAPGYGGRRGGLFAFPLAFAPRGGVPAATLAGFALVELAENCVRVVSDSVSEMMGKRVKRKLDTFQFLLEFADHVAELDELQCFQDVRSGYGLVLSCGGNIVGANDRCTFVWQITQDSS